MCKVVAHKLSGPVEGRALGRRCSGSTGRDGPARLTYKVKGQVRSGRSGKRAERGREGRRNKRRTAIGGGERGMEGAFSTRAGRTGRAMTTRPTGNDGSAGACVKTQGVARNLSGPVEGRALGRRCIGSTGQDGPARRT